MSVAVAITSVTDPIGSGNVTAVVASGTTDANTNTVSVTVVDSANVTAGPFAATVSSTTWSISASNVSALADGPVTYMATATDLSNAKAFDAVSALKATTVADYITTAELRDYLKDPSGTQNPTAIAAAISAASRAVDAFCGRHFYQTTQTQYFTPEQGFLWRLDLDDMDLASTSGLTVQVEFGIDGTYPTTYTLGTDFIAQPINQSVGGVDGWPYTWLQSVNGKLWPPRYAGFQRDTVKITGQWGWPAVPLPVKQATKILAAQFFELGGAPFGVAGFGDFAAVRVRDNPIAASLLGPYAKNRLLFA